MTVKQSFRLEMGIAATVLLFAALAMLSAVRGDAEVRPNRFSNTWQLRPQAIPTTLTNIADLDSTNAIPRGRDLYVCYADVSMSPGSAAVNVTIQDGQGTPIPMFPVVPVTPTSSTGAMYQILQTSNDDGCRWFPKGISIQASASGAYITLSGKY